MKLFSIRAAFITAALLPILPLKAAFEPKIVSADAKWVLYVDLASFRDSTIGKEVVAAATKLQTQAAQQKQIPLQVDIAKLLTTIGSITAYGANYTQDPSKLDGTLIIQGTADLRKIAEGAIAQATVSSPAEVVQLKDFPLEAYSVGNGEQQLVVAFPKEPIVVLSKSKTQVMKALEVYRGSAPSLAKATDSAVRQLLMANGDKHPYLRAACLVPSEQEFPGGAPQARVLQMAKSAGVGLGETDTHAFIHLELLASDDEMADKLQKIVQGLAAMASLAESNDKQLAEFLQTMAVKRDGRTVSLDALYQSQRVVQLVKDMQNQEQKAPQHGHHPAKPEGKMIAEWVADQDLGGESASAEQLVYHTIENVSLKQGMTIILSGRPDKGEHARLDVVEIAPAAGGPALRFEAEGMLLKNYSRENAAYASGGKVISSRELVPATARFQFPAADGVYTIKVRYLDEKDGQSTFSVSLVDPAESENGQ